MTMEEFERAMKEIRSLNEELEVRKLLVKGYRKKGVLRDPRLYGQLVKPHKPVKFVINPLSVSAKQIDRRIDRMK